ncbi:unnamed protein product, partial [Amoebophrya sp. A25]|eukprot:GSA25T00022051001.1
MDLDVAAKTLIGKSLSRREVGEAGRSILVPDEARREQEDQELIWLLHVALGGLRTSGPGQVDRTRLGFGGSSFAATLDRLYNAQVQERLRAREEQEGNLFAPIGIRAAEVGGPLTRVITPPPVSRGQVGQGHSHLNPGGRLPGRPRLPTERRRRRPTGQIDDDNEDDAENSPRLQNGQTASMPANNPLIPNLDPMNNPLPPRELEEEEAQTIRDRQELLLGAQGVLGLGDATAPARRSLWQNPGFDDNESLKVLGKFFLPPEKIEQLRDWHVRERENMLKLDPEVSGRVRVMRSGRRRWIVQNVFLDLEILYHTIIAVAFQGKRFKRPDVEADWHEDEAGVVSSRSSEIDEIFDFIPSRSSQIKRASLAKQIDSWVPVLLPPPQEFAEYMNVTGGGQSSAEQEFEMKGKRRAKQLLVEKEKDHKDQGPVVSSRISSRKKGLGDAMGVVEFKIHEDQTGSTRSSSTFEDSRSPATEQ